MTLTKTRRGRPIGSGIDDTLRLQQIGQMISADPSVRPTTAIKRLGEFDPSVIRRLRDKFQELADAGRSQDAHADQTEAPTRGAPATAQAALAAKATSPKEDALTASVPRPLSPRARTHDREQPSFKVVPYAAPPIDRTVQSQSQVLQTQFRDLRNRTAIATPGTSSCVPTFASAGFDLFQSYEAILGLSVRTASTLLEAHTHMAEQMLRQPVLDTWISSQTLMADMLVMVAFPSQSRPALGRA